MRGELVEEPAQFVAFRVIVCAPSRSNPFMLMAKLPPLGLTGVGDAFALRVVAPAAVIVASVIGAPRPLAKPLIKNWLFCSVTS